MGRKKTNKKKSEPPREIEYNPSILDFGLCPICARMLINDEQSIDRHHFVPKSLGGKTQHYIHKICHQKIHATWSLQELKQRLFDPELIKKQSEMEGFLAWIVKKDPQFYLKTKTSHRKKSRST